MATLEGRVLITGGAGFLARGIYRRALAEHWPAEFTCLSRDDAKHAELQSRYPWVQTVLGDVGTIDVDRLTDLMRGFDIVIHAAASKYVDRAEHAAFDTVRTNIEGSRRVAEAALRAHVKIAVAISTDKACHPVNIYGATKLVMERLWQEAAGREPNLTVFVGVRYGNVVGSTGSVLTLFEKQIAEGGIKLTDPEMTRFWMSIDEAVNTILIAVNGTSPGAVHTGTITIPAMRAMRMRDVVNAALGGDEIGAVLPDNIEIIGMRPGEKKHEAIVHRQESVRVMKAAGPLGYRHLHPPGVNFSSVDPYEITSADPPRGWLSPGDLRAMVDDAATV